MVLEKLDGTVTRQKSVCTTLQNSTLIQHDSFDQVIRNQNAFIALRNLKTQRRSEDIREPEAVHFPGGNTVTNMKAHGQ